MSRTPLAVLDAAHRVSAYNDALGELLKPGVDLRGSPVASAVATCDRPRIDEALASLDARVASRIPVRLAEEHFREPMFATLEIARARGGDDARVSVVMLPGAPDDGSASVLELLLAHVPALLWTIDGDGTCTHARGKAIGTGFEPGDLVGLNLLELFQENPEVAGAIVRALAGEGVDQTTSPAPGTRVHTWYLPMQRAGDARPSGAIGFALDVSKHAEDTELRERLELIERQGATIRALATPIIELWDEVLCLPVIGTVDSARTAEMMQGLLRAIVRKQARYAIVDLTGVEIVDSSTADHLIRLFRAARVLGVSGILCGIRPAVANTVVALGLDLGSIRMMRSLKEALRWCIREREARSVAPRAPRAGREREREPSRGGEP